ncbi:MAG: DUF1553 domain-containing protein [Bryobacteraceae bacterium]
MTLRSLRFVAIVSIFTLRIALAQTSAKDVEYFETKVRPVLAQNCYQCHGPQSKTAFGNLRLVSRSALLKGGDSGPALDLGNPAQSLLLRAVRYEGPLTMPPTGKMKADDIDALVQWVKIGAPWPETPEVAPVAPAARKSVEERRKDHWAWQPVKRKAPPAVKNTQWPRGAVDQFVLAKLEEKHLSPAPPANPYTLIRRIYFAITGLPPKPEDVEAFVKDPSDTALAAMVDKLLASPQFGERWGRNWLDSTYFADTMDVGRRIPAKHAWRYRDYVIDSFNRDKPFNQFAREQIAGDLMPYTTNEQRRTQVIATGFLSLGPWALVNADKDQLKMDVVDLQIDMIGKSFLGLTLACARCHDHKFDPIPQKDYYSVAGILTSTQTLKGIMTDVFSDLNRLRLPETPAEAAEFEREMAKYDGQFQQLKGREDSLDHRKQEKEAKLAAFRKAQPEKGDKAEEDRLTKDAGEVESQLNELRSRIKLLEYMKPVLPQAFAVEDAEKPANTNLTIRGNAHMLGDEVPRGFVQIATLSQPPAIQKGSGRLELAQWLASPSNPLTARVYVNRAWYDIFGEGIVRSVDNFGLRGEKPSHPELLDYLAANFIEQGWSVKKLVREMVLSQTFRMASSPNRAMTEVDPENRLLWRMNRKRLSGEEIRDAILQIDGQLEAGRGGPSLGLEIPGNLKPFEPTFVDEKLRLREDIRNRRTVYLPVLRKSQMDSLDMLNLFGFPDANQINGQRANTSVPTQALYLMNSPFYREQSQVMARLVEDRLGLYDRARVADLIWRVYNRPATDQEVQEGLDFVYEIERMLRKQPNPPANSIEEAWTRYCQTLFASSEFLFKG